MTEQVDLDALIAEALDLLENGSGSGWESDAEDMIRRLADALESTLAERDEARKTAEDHVLDAEAVHARLSAELRKERRDHAREIDGWQEAFDEVLMERDAYRERADEATVLSHQFRNERDKAREAIKRALDVQMFRVGTTSYGEEYMNKVQSVLREGLAKNRN